LEKDTPEGINNGNVPNYSGQVCCGVWGGGRSVPVSSSGELALMCSGQGEEELLQALSVRGVGAARLGKALFEVSRDERYAGPVQGV